MRARPAHRQAAVRMHPRHAARPVSRRGKPPRRITAVTRISSAGMLPKHASGKFSHVSLFWETSMQLGKKFFRGRSQFARVPRYAAAEAEKEPRPTILAASVGLMFNAVARCAQCADLAFANFPVAMLSWILAQFFAGCAAYAEAMYPSIAYFPETEDADRRDPLQSTPSSCVNSGRSPALVPDLRELSQLATGDSERRSLLPIAGRTQSIAARSGGTEKIVRLQVMRRTRSGRLVSITLRVTAWLSRRRRPGGGRQAIVELRRHDRRALRGVGLLR